MKKIIAAILAIAMLVGLVPVAADTPDEPVFDDMADTTDVESRIDMVAADAALSIEAKSCVLMEAATGKVLYAENAEEALPPASVTKIMSLLLAMEAIDAGRISEEDTVQVSANAAGKGGSQVFLKEGEQITVSDLLKSIAVASGNDATAAIAEYIAGSEEAFVVMMIEKAAELGMANTTFINCTGLDDDGTNLTSAYDIALMSRELMKHEKIFNYTTIWMDSIRDGQFGLNNTNKLVRFYSGTNGLKTGSTSKAKFCISATAKREDMQTARLRICQLCGRHHPEGRELRARAGAQRAGAGGHALHGAGRYPHPGRQGQAGHAGKPGHSGGGPAGAGGTGPAHRRDCVHGRGTGGRAFPARRQGRRGAGEFRIPVRSDLENDHDLTSA